MEYQYDRIADTATQLIARAEQLSTPRDVLKAVELKALYEEIKTLAPAERAQFGKEVNMLKQQLEATVANRERTAESADVAHIDVTAPFDSNVAPVDRPAPLPVNQGSRHPLTQELEAVLDIYARMGFEAVESPELDDDYHMFGALNFPEGHPARDDYDSFMTEQKDASGKPYIAPAHTSTMQNRVLKDRKHALEAGGQIAVVIPGRVFRNEDLDARHEHTFYQLEGVFVGTGIHAGNLIAVLQTFFETYYGKKIEVRTQPFYFPFTEPSFEFMIACPFCDKAGCHICGVGWLEMLGCGMIHPNVLREAGIDPEVYTGFAWGGGIERLVMIKHQIEDIRHFESAKLDFLRQF